MKEAILQKDLGNGRIKCGTCLRGCVLKHGQTGFCGNYKNIKGKLYNIGYGLVSSIESRPIEIKPFFHFYPGSYATTFSGWGCNFICPWCQNWHLSRRKPNPSRNTYIPPKDLVRKALVYGDDGLCASFNEPTIHLEYLVDVFTLGKKYGLYNTAVSNGSLTSNALRKLRMAGLDAINVDIKGCINTYKRYIGIPNPENILDVARQAKQLGIHVESVFLIVTKANDTEECVEWVINKHIKYLGVDTPLHINRYYPAFKYDRPPTDINLLINAFKLARREGIKYVYIGNIHVTDFLNTKCPKCGKVLIYRTNYETIKCVIGKDNKCPRCGERIPIVGYCRESSRVII